MALALAAPPPVNPSASTQLRRLGDGKPSVQRHPEHLRRTRAPTSESCGTTAWWTTRPPPSQRTPDPDGFRRHIRHPRLSGRPLAAEHPVPQRRRQPRQRHHPNGPDGSTGTTSADRRDLRSPERDTIHARQIIFPEGLPAGMTLIPTAGISVPTRDPVRRHAVRQLHVGHPVGRAGPMDDELLRDRVVRRQWRDLPRRSEHRPIQPVVDW